MSPQGEHAQRDAAARRAAAEDAFTEWAMAQSSMAPKQWATDLLAGLEEEAKADLARRQARAQANRDRRDAGYGY